MPDTTKITENRVTALVSLDNGSFTGEAFQTITGGEVNISDNVRDRDVGSNSDDPLQMPSTTTDITVTRAWRTDRDEVLLKKAHAAVGRVNGTVGKVLRDLNQNQAGLLTYKVLLTGASGPNGDTNGNGKGMMSLTFAVYGLPA